MYKFINIIPATLLIAIIIIEALDSNGETFKCLIIIATENMTATINGYNTQFEIIEYIPPINGLNKSNIEGECEFTGLT
jgi:hypothetical protein